MTEEKRERGYRACYNDCRIQINFKTDKGITWAMNHARAMAKEHGYKFEWLEAKPVHKDEWYF